MADFMDEIKRSARGSGPRMTDVKVWEDRLITEFRNLGWKNQGDPSPIQLLDIADYPPAAPAGGDEP